MCYGISRMLQRLDLFGHSFRLYFNRETNLKTSYGGFVTILIVTFTVICIWFFGNEVIYKQSPYVVEKINGDWNRTNMTPKINMAFTVENHLGIVITNYEKYFSIGATSTNFTYTMDLDYIMEKKNVPLVKCKKDNFSNELQFEFFDLEYAYCMKNIDQIGG